MMYLEQIGAYWDSRAEGYSLTIHEQFETSVDEYFRDLLRSSAPVGKSLSCLDAGCGPGFFSILLAQEGHTVTAVDCSEEMLTRARDNFSEMGVEVSTLRGDVQNLPFQNESFDYIVSRNLVWNLEHPENAYREWIRLLRPGGRLLVADGNHYLHYYDEEYLCAKDQDQSGDNHRCYGVDPTPINEIARDLPLSRVRRPHWDIEQFLSLGVCRINFEVSRKFFTDSASNEKKSVVSDFVLCAEKPPAGQPLAGEEEQRRIDEHWSAASGNYSRIIHDELDSFRVDAWMKRILANAPRKDALDVLDAGCGPAFFSIVLSRNGHRVTGLDSSGDMLKHAAANAATCNVHPLFVKGDCHALPFADNSFDLVVSRNVTHALRDHRKAYSEWFRVLRPKGVLLIFDANWHLLQIDQELLEEFIRREEECLRRYGSTFSGEGKRESEEYRKKAPHRLGNSIRPEWDVPILKQAGFTGISFEKNIIDGLWDGKEKLLYGATPMFMISASKPA